MHDDFVQGQEQDLLRRAGQDPNAFLLLYDHYFPRIFAYISYRVGRAQDAEDLTAETFLRVVDRWDDFRWEGEGSFTAWLFRIAHNLTNNYYRDHRRRNEQVSLESLPEIEDSRLLPADTLLKKERFAELQALIRSLPPRRQEIVTLRFFGQLRNKEIARILGLDERTVAAHLCRALRDLHQMYVNETKQSREEDPHVRAK